MGGCLAAIAEGRADITIGEPLPVTNIQGIKFEKILSTQWQFVVAENHALTQFSLSLENEDIKAFPMIVIKDSSKFPYFIASNF